MRSGLWGVTGCGRYPVVDPPWRDRATRLTAGLPGEAVPPAKRGEGLKERSPRIVRGRHVRWPIGGAIVGGLVLLLIANAAYPGKEEQPDPPAVSKNAADSDDPPEPAKDKAEKKPKQNPLAGCTLCHVDIEDEYVESEHFEEKVACIECHGPSKGHIADENNEVKPDEVFARKDVDRLCSECHDCGRKIPPGWSDLPLDKRKVCSECHVSHEFAKSSQ